MTIAVIGSAVSFLSGGQSELPGHIAVPNHRVGGGYLRANGFLPSSCSPFELNRDVAAKKLAVRDLDFYPGLDFQRVERRVDFVRRLDQFSRSLDRVEDSATNPGLDQALKLIQSQSARQAFELKREPANIRLNTASSSSVNAACTPGDWSKRERDSSQ